MTLTRHCPKSVHFFARHSAKGVHLFGELLTLSLRQPGPGRQVTIWSPGTLILVRKLPKIFASGNLIIPLSRPLHPDF